ncbi:hypothetical protein HYY74_06495 [Candidatus Woesearchaeota archaeon]|nr:hypothetical protein [Candidatus Woesearchaeota archaeon]
MVDALEVSVAVEFRRRVPVAGEKGTISRQPGEEVFRPHRGGYNFYSVSDPGVLDGNTTVRIKDETFHVWPAGAASFEYKVERHAHHTAYRHVFTYGQK